MVAGTVCGHWFWDNDNFARVVCQQLGFADGVGYTFGSTRLLPTLPIVTGFRQCEGTERSLFECPESPNAGSHGGDVIDRDCWIGCRGADGVSGTPDDSVDPTCTHSIDQGVICQSEDSPQRRNAGNTGVARCYLPQCSWSQVSMVSLAFIETVVILNFKL